MQQIPILLITFNRPDHVRQVLDVILKQNPKELYSCQDGARDSNNLDRIKCQEVRDVINELTSAYAISHTDFRLHTLYQEKNLGCGPGPAAGISWFFEHVEMGIILEDDAVPHPDFFEYAATLLEKYKDDESVRAIGSMNVDTQKWGDGSYYFSMMNRNLCAWATWRRAWQAFDLRLMDVSKYQLQRVLRKYSCTAIEREYWCDRLTEIHKDGCGGASWDIQFFMSIWLSRGKGIIPNENISSNIGTVGEATHQMAAGNIIDKVPTQPILPLVHPSTTNIQGEADRQFHYRYFEPGKQNWPWWLICYNILNRRVKKLLGIKGQIRNRKS
jgi:hypothetical protein